MELFLWISEKIVKLSAFTIISIGLSLTSYGIYIIVLVNFYDYDGFFKFDSDLGMFGQIYGSLIIGIALILIGIFGILGSISKKICFQRGFLFLYHICVFLFGILFLVVFYLLIFKAKEYFGQSCESTPNFKELSDGVKSANESFCSISCPCNLNANNFEDKSVLKGKIGFASEFLPSNVQGCIGFDSKSYSYAIQLLNILEYNFQCSGWCKSTQIFIFSDVNRGNTSGVSCFNQFESYYKSYVTIIGYISMSLGILFLLSFTVIFCLYCSKGKQKKPSSQELNLLYK